MEPSGCPKKPNHIAKGAGHIRFQLRPLQCRTTLHTQDGDRPEEEVMEGPHNVIRHSTTYSVLLPLDEHKQCQVKILAICRKRDHRL